MFARRILIASLLIAAVLSMSFSAQTAHAQATPAGTCTSADYASPINYIAKILQSASYSKPDSVGNAIIALISTRYQYEDAVPPAGCEAVQAAALQYLTIEEDSLYTTEAAKVDTANKDGYNDIATNLAPPRYKTITAALNGSLGNITVADAATMPAVPTGAAPAAAPQPCADPAFASSVKADTDTMNGGPSDIGIKAIKLRYKYEDATAPAGCEDSRKTLIQLFAITEDYGALMVMAQVDTANAATYTDFLSKTVGARATTLSATAKSVFPALAGTPAATAAASS